jgi:hypothetical protein
MATMDKKALAKKVSKIDQVQKDKEKFVKAHGYKKHKGYRVDSEEFEDGVSYVPKEMLLEMLPLVDFWMQDDSEFATDDIDEIIGMIEDDEGIKFGEEKKQ